STGLLVYQSGTIDESITFQWLDSSGKTEPIGTKHHNYLSTPRVSPDGTRLALRTEDGGVPNISIYDLKRDIMTRLTFEPDPIVGYPVWTPDGRFIAYRSAGGISLVHSDGAATADGE